MGLIWKLLKKLGRMALGLVAKELRKRPMILLNTYGVDMGTSGLIIQAQSREEVYMRVFNY